MNSTVWRLIRNVGITSTLKNYVTMSSDRSVILRNADWDAHDWPRLLTTLRPDILICVPLYVLLGFCEDYKHVINARHELILIRACNDNCLRSGDRTNARIIQSGECHMCY